jgi:hypothetical protein
MMGLSGPFAFVNTIAIRVVSAETTNGPRAFRKLSTSPSAIFCSADFFIISDIPATWLLGMASNLVSDFQFNILAAAKLSAIGQRGHVKIAGSISLDPNRYNSDLPEGRR